MGPLAARLLLESTAAPFLLAALIMISGAVIAPASAFAGRPDRGWFRELAPALAILAAIGITHILAFGWPPSLTLDARMKIMLAAILGLVVGWALDHGISGARLGLILLAIGLPIWVGLPALLLAKPESARLVLPIAIAFGAHAIAREKVSPDGTPQIIILTSIALGLAAIAVFAKAFSFAELGLAFASALLAILMISRAPLGTPASLAAAAVLLALFTALLLYSQASLPALLILTAAIGADRLARGSRDDSETRTPRGRLFFFCLLPVATAILIARIDAGPISIY
ncbi:MAG: hypothetical protein ACR2QJ_01105 [Geminicoccaceae bacterium]